MTSPSNPPTDSSLFPDASPEAVPEAPPEHPWHRYVALGDSFTEGIGDPSPESPGGHRGWADRVAEELARDRDDFAYANLAIRGRLLNQILEEQLEPAIELRPDLVTICAGGNDVIRPGGDPDRLAEKMDGAVARLAESGATVVLFTGPDLGTTPVLGSVRGRVAIYNENLRTIAARHDIVMADMWALRELSNREMWAPDRLHFSPLGHHTIAAMVLETLGVEHTLEPLEPKPLPAKNWRTARTEDLTWARDYFVPWVVRRVRHRSSGDGIAAKRPVAGPLFGGQGMPPGSGD
ncbi:SGNH/GDSL hydrolase family protein [Arthrobacter jiangjiafuii]|uniref:SGNH/GDSL hydrolase family protein n=1 Tax=Arthrobacter jiangjiafuii TaxID=2817475 RepID=A0A975M744_9MICC|nr:SGNH/GDSL hydrolase family protein [Arthrobacter jiangjiafuii]MBP3044038.1 SGNH/GDSL hydrolase family protein [Arthrobacter jiangjiafuii]QWC11025.1 SGNH/GDSL hydrolase family protein [Arthrobacter jiangjiafuii]